MKVLVAVCIALLGFSSEMEEEKLSWNENRKLVWTDFKGVPEGAIDYVASTNSGVSFSFSYRERNGMAEISYTVVSNFYPQLSWFRPGKVNDYVLQHEQTHFDISEVHARKLRMLLAEIPHNREFKDAAGLVYEQMEEERRAMQERYDLESDHSNIETAELRWRAYVLEQLKAYERWK